MEDVDATAETLRAAASRFRTDVVDGVGGRQVVIEDASGNPVELFSRRGRRRACSSPADAVSPRGDPS